MVEALDFTLSQLNKYYNKASDFVASQQDKIANGRLYEKIGEYNPLISTNVAEKQTDPFLTRLANNVSSHKIQYLSVFTIGIGLNTYLLYKYQPQLFGSPDKTNKRPRRKVPRLANGARKDVVLVVGSPTEPLTRLIALDFEKRGFIVYLTILDEKDFKYIESNPITNDINYLNFADSYSYDMQLVKFRHLLDTPVTPFIGANPHKLNLKAVVFAPNLYFPIGPIEKVSVASWNRILDRFSVYFKLFSSGLVDLMRHEQSKIVLITTNIVSSLNMPYHAPETIFQNALRSLFTTLSREIKHQGLCVTQVKLGNLNVTNSSNSDSKISTIVNSEIRNWDEDTKSIYADTFSRSEIKSNPIRTTGKGSSLREFHHVLFDIIYTNKNKSSVIYYGTGAKCYDKIARCLPESIIEFFLT